MKDQSGEDNPNWRGGKVAVTCIHCGVEFKVNQYRLLHENPQFCSKDCMITHIRQSEADRFWVRVDKGSHPDGCWPWRGMVASNGYGRVSRTRDVHLTAAHRVAYELTYGPIPEGLFACHHCDNPPCVRPDHLFLGTYADNMADMVSKGRQSYGERNANCKLNEAQVIEIRRLSQLGVSARELSEMFPITQAHVYCIIRGLNWRKLLNSAEVDTTQEHQDCVEVIL